MSSRLNAGIKSHEMDWRELPYLYPPAVAMLVSPLTAIPDYAVRIWSWVNLVLLVVGIRWAAAAVNPARTWCEYCQTDSATMSGAVGSIVLKTSSPLRCQSIKPCFASAS